MPKGPKGEQRPADVIGMSVKVMRIATGEIEEDPASSKAQVLGGKNGAASRALKLTDQQKSEIARVAANARWKKSDS